MEARYLIVARFAEFGIDGKLNMIGGDQDKIIAQGFPAVHRVLIGVSKLELNREDLQREHSFKSCISKEDGEIIMEGISGTINQIDLPPGINVINTGITLTFVNVVFPEAG